MHDEREGPGVPSGGSGRPPGGGEDEPEPSDGTDRGRTESASASRESAAEAPEGAGEPEPTHPRSSEDRADLDDALSKRLQSLQRPTWELELLISGAVVFSLFQLPEILRRWFEGIAPHAGSDVGLLPFMAFYSLTLIDICLAVAFSLHFILRSVWVGLTGLRSVFPRGIEWDQLDIGPISLAVYRKMNPSLRAAEERLDRVASSVFAVLFAVVIGLVSAFALFLIPLVPVELVRSRFFPDVPAMLVFYVVVLGLLLPMLPIQLIDSWFKRDPERIERHPKLFALGVRWGTVLQRLLLAPLSTPVLLTLSSRWSWKKVTAGLVFSGFLAFVIFFVYFAVASGLVAFDSYVYYPLRSSVEVVEARHYADQRIADGAERAGRSPFIPSEVVEGPLMRLFVPFRVERDANRVATVCPELEPVRSEGFFFDRRRDPDDEGRNRELLDCVGEIYLVRLDGDAVEPQWAFHRDPGSDLRGLLTYLDVSELAPGRHELLVARIAAKDEDRFGAEAGVEAPADGQSGVAIADRDRYRFPFWVPGSVAPQPSGGSRDEPSSGLAGNAGGIGAQGEGAR